MVVNDSVIFYSDLLGSTVGTYSFSFDANGVSTVAGTFTVQTNSSALTDNFINQNIWNTDRMDGTGISGVIFSISHH